MTSPFKFPRHEGSLNLTHNDHKDVYKTVKQQEEDGDNDWCDWVSDEQREKAIATNELWTLQWYPDTPVGFYGLKAADLDVLLAAALEFEKETS